MIKLNLNNFLKDRPFKKPFQYLFIFIVLLFSYILFMMLGSSFQPKSIQGNLNASYDALVQEGLYKSEFGDSTAMWDNWTDSLLLNIIANQSGTNVLESAIANNKTINDSEQSVLFDLGLALDLEHDSTETTEDYSRYWVGIITPLKLLLTIFNLQQIRYLIFILFSLLQCILFVKLNKSLNMSYSIAYLFSTTIICTYYNVSCLAFSTDLLIMQIFMLYILAKHNTGFWQKNRTLHYFVIGSFTFFINFLSAPLLTLGLPVILDMLLDNGHKNKLWTATKAIFAWIGGYGITILAKQIMAKLVLGQQSGLWQILHWSGLGMAEGSDDTSIISRILSGSSGLDNQVTFTDRLLKVVVRSADVINPTTGFILVTIIIAVIILILLKKIKLILPDRQIIPVFFMIGALPFLWLFIFAVHAGHGFDSMSLSVFIFSLLSFGASFIKIDNN